MIRGLQSHDAEALLPRMMPALKSIAGRSHSRWSVEDIVDEIRAHTVQVWVCGEYQAVALTRVWPEAVSIVACAGEGARRGKTRWSPKSGLGRGILGKASADRRQAGLVEMAAVARVS